MPLEPRASWFSPKCVEAQQLTGHLGVKHCFGAGRESGTKSRQTLNTRYDPKGSRSASETMGDKLHRREGNSPDHQLRPLNDRSVIKEVGVQRQPGGPKIRPKGVVDGQQVNIPVLPLVGPEGRRRLGEPATEAPVNGGRNYNGPKVAKFLVGTYGPRDSLRLIFPKSSHRREGLAPRCRLFATWGCSMFQGLGCSPIKAVRELGSERRETVRSISGVGVRALRGPFPSTRGPGRTHLWCTSYRAHDSPVAQPRQRRVLCPCGDGATEVLRIQEKVTARRAVYHYDRHSPSIFIVQLFDNMKKPKALPSLSIYPGDGRAEAFGVLQSRIEASQSLANMLFSCLSLFMVRYSGVLGVEEPHQSIPNLVVKLYCGDDTVGEVLRKNSSTPG
ncbi:hypothetical protein Scep_031004 [Stephania cephalantha]|uniref:Uncharacterized protein n=1 Tax=Stephania cephalantha TaxID=152367 RepID=A0AAP0HDQ5_9MAGN